MVVINQGGPVVNHGPKRPVVCMKALFNINLALKAVWPRCKDE